MSYDVYCILYINRFLNYGKPMPSRDIMRVHDIQYLFNLLVLTADIADRQSASGLRRCGKHLHFSFMQFIDECISLVLLLRSLHVSSIYNCLSRNVS